MKNKKRKYKFLNSIDREEFDHFTQDEKEKYLIENNIFVPHPDLDDPFFNYPDENGNILRDDFFSAHYVSDSFLEEMIAWYKEIGSDFITEFEGYRERFTRRIDLALDDADRLRIIRNEYEWLFRFDLCQVFRSHCASDSGSNSATFIKFVL